MYSIIQGDVTQLQIALLRHPLAGEPEADIEFDTCVAVCNMISRGTPLEPEMVTAGVKCCQVNQVRAPEAGMGQSGVKDATPTLPGYSKEELKTLQGQNAVLSGFCTFWDQKCKPCQQEMKSLPRAVKTLFKQWKHIKERDGLLYGG